MKSKNLKRTKCFISGFLLSMAIVLFATYISPRIFAFSGMEFTLATTILGVLLLLSIPFLLAIFFVNLRKNSQEQSFVSILGSTTIVLLIFLAATATLSILFALLAVLIETIFKNSLDTAALKFIINICIEAIALLLMPIFISALFGSAYQEGGIFQGIRLGLKQCRQNYLKLLAIMVVAALVGHGIIWLFQPGSIFFGAAAVLKTIFLSILGAVSLVLCAKICESNT